MGSTGQTKKNIKMQRHRILCSKLPDGHLKFECSVLSSNVDFYFKFDEYLNCFLTALLSDRKKLLIHDGPTFAHQ